MIMNYDMDRTSCKRNRKLITKVVKKNTWEEISIFDAWSYMHTSYTERDFIHYSVAHSLYSIIYFMQKESRDRIKECQIGMADLSDHFSRDYFIERIKKNADEIHPMVIVIVQSYNDVIPRAVSVLYSALMEAKHGSTLYVEAKWEKELSEKIPDNMCSCMVYFPHMIQVTWMERIPLLFVNKNTSQQLNTRQPSWRMCNCMDPNHTGIISTLCCRRD